MNRFLLSVLASHLVGETVTVGEERQADCLGEARMGRAGHWEIVLDPRIWAGEVLGLPPLWSFLHECGHIALGHCHPQHVTDADRAAARLRNAYRWPLILAVAAEREREADTWATERAPQLAAACLELAGMTFDELARGA